MFRTAVASGTLNIRVGAWQGLSLHRKAEPLNPATTLPRDPSPTWEFPKIGGPNIVP